MGGFGAPFLLTYSADFLNNIIGGPVLWFVHCHKAVHVHGCRSAAAVVVASSPAADMAGCLGARLLNDCLPGPGVTDMLRGPSETKHAGEKRDLLLARPWTNAALGRMLDARDVKEAVARRRT